MPFNHLKIEKKWQKRWEKAKIFEVVEDDKKADKKQYILDMFPYPSAEGLHVGHVEGYTAADIIVRYRRMRGFYVLHPMGWDAFGLPAENYAIKKGIPPWETTQRAIKNFSRQIKALGLSYDWSREISTADPKYYKWTQWLFLLLYKNGLAYRAKAPVNWCPFCQTVLANEQVVDGHCERCKNEVAQKELEQWFFRITAFVERLLKDLDKIDWPERIKETQKNWIGRSEGALIKFPLESFQFLISVFTTRADTLFGVTYLVLAPEHPLVDILTEEKNRETVQKYVKEAKKKSEFERLGADRKKSGVPLGAYALNPLSDEKIPVWIADYVLLSYGAGAVMGVPAHDERDFEFAKKHNLKIKPVVAPLDERKWVGDNVSLPEEFYQKAYTNFGYLVNSKEFSGLDSEIAKEKIIKALREKKLGEKTVFYHMRDWLISRQRYWGAPIPIIYCRKCWEIRNSIRQTGGSAGELAEEIRNFAVIDGKEHAIIPVPEDDLPVLLPRDVDFRPTGESPLARSKTFHKRVRCPVCKSLARREVDTMDTFVCSSWYYLRYCDPKNDKQFAESSKLKYWCPVDLYIGGAEHAVMHLLYARFFAKILHDLELIDFDEPFLKLVNQGLILGEDGQKMSKSLGNVINPDDVARQYGADALRMYEMFMGDFEEAKPWNARSIIGIRRFFERVWQLREKVANQESGIKNQGLEKLLHKTIKKVTEDIETFKFNTAISALMILVNEMSKQNYILPATYYILLKLLHPFAPHITEELWEKLNVEFGMKNVEFLARESWPKWEMELVREEEIDLVVQMNGKVRDTLRVAADISEDAVKEAALQSEKIKKWLIGQKIKKMIFIKGRLLNIVIE